MIVLLRRRPRLAALAAALCLLLAPVAAVAASLDDAKAAGWVGERPDGFLGLVSVEAPEDVQTLVEDINAKRTVHYEAIAEKEGTSITAVAVLAGKKLLERTPAGQYVMGPDGEWVKK